MTKAMTVNERADHACQRILGNQVKDVDNILRDQFTLCLYDHGCKPETLQQKQWDIEGMNKRLRQTVDDVRRMLDRCQCGSAGAEAAFRQDVNYLLGHIETRLL